MLKLKTWFDKNKLSLNLGKTKLMLFGNHKENKWIQLQIQGVNIEMVKENKFLGVIIDEKLNWKAHILHIQTKISKNLAVLNKVKHFIDEKALHILYCSLVSPYLTYCAEVWGNNY